MHSTKRKINLPDFLRRFRKQIKLPKRKPRRPILLVPAGPSRVGKTTVLKYVQKKLPYFVRITHDEMRLFLYKRGFPDTPAVENFLYRSAPSFALAEIYLRKGYGVIIDDNFASKPIKFTRLMKLVKKFRVGFFVIQIWAPAKIVRKRLRGAKSKLFKDWRRGIEHFERSRKEFDYEKFNKLYAAKINTARPLPQQLDPVIEKFKTAMDL